MFHPEVFGDDETFNKFIQLYLLHHTFRNETIQSYHNGRSPTFDYNLNNKIYDNIEHKYDKTRRNKNIKHTIDITINLNNQEEETRQDARVKYKQIYDRIRQRIHKQFPSLPSEKNPQLPNPTPSSNNNPTQSHDKPSKEKYPQLSPRLPDDPFKPENPITSNGKIKPRKITNLKQIDDYLKQQEKQIKRHHRQIQKNLDNCVSWRREMMKTKNKPQYKRWNWTQNNATRHTCNDGQIVPLEEKFIIINDKTGDLDYMDYPGDWSASASNTANCLCGITFTDNPKGAEDYPKFKQRKQEEAKKIQEEYQKAKENREERRKIKKREEIIKELKKKEKEKTEKPKRNTPKEPSKLTYETLNTPKDIAEYYGLKYQKINDEYHFTDEQNNTEIIIDKFFTRGFGATALIDNKNKGRKRYDLKEVIKLYDEAPSNLKQATPKIEFDKTPRRQENILGTTSRSTSRVKIYGSALMKSKTDNGNLRAVLYHEMGHALDNNVNKEYSYGNKFEKAIQDDYSYQTRHDFTEELSSDYAESNFEETGTYSENWAESVSIVAQSHLENKETAVLNDKNGNVTTLEEWKEKHPNVYEYVYHKVYDK